MLQLLNRLLLLLQAGVLDDAVAGGVAHIHQVAVDLICLHPVYDQVYHDFAFVALRAQRFASEHFDVALSAFGYVGVIGDNLHNFLEELCLAGFRHFTILPVFVKKFPVLLQCLNLSSHAVIFRALL